MQLDQDFCQLIDWLNENYQKTLHLFQRAHLSQGVRVVWENGFEPASNLLHLIAILFAFAGDVLKRFNRHLTIMFATVGFAVSLPLFAGIQFGVVPEALAPYASTFIVSVLIVAVLSSLILPFQRGREHGALAEWIPGIERLQKGLEALLEGQKRHERLLTALMDAVRGGSPAVQGDSPGSAQFTDKIPRLTFLSPTKGPSNNNRIGISQHIVVELGWFAPYLDS